ncbi:MAG: Hint domain-containing protein [Oligoflexales bacterium]
MLKEVLVIFSLLASTSALSKGFAEGTLIRVAGQPIPIEEIKVNDEIVSCRGSECVIGRVSETKNSFEPTIQITTEKNEVIVASEDQMFFIHACWKPASELMAGDFLETPEGHIEITDVKTGHEEKVYTFEVADYHTFFAYNALVHNPEGPYRLGNGPYGQSQGVAHDAGEYSEATKAAVKCYGKAAARGCSNAATAGKLGGAKGLQHLVNCATGALVEVSESLVMGDCSPAEGATLNHDFTGAQYDFDQTTFNTTGQLEACGSGGHCSTVQGADNEANGINQDNYNVVESVGNNTAISPAE